MIRWREDGAGVLEKAEKKQNVLEHTAILGVAMECVDVVAARA